MRGRKGKGNGGRGERGNGGRGERGNEGVRGGKGKG